MIRAALRSGGDRPPVDQGRSVARRLGDAARAKLEGAFAALLITDFAVQEL
jgi:hypothetical protein